MKLLTLNTHSWMEQNPIDNLNHLTDAIFRRQFDVVALQEINQSLKLPPVSSLSHYVEAEKGTVIKEDNFANLLQKKLAEKGLTYHWTWVPSHIGYDRFDEGVALLSRKPIQQVQTFCASGSPDYTNAWTRKVLGIQNKDGWFFSLHLGWWGDKSDPFKEQWKRASSYLSELDGPVFLCGDFNNPSHIKGEGYDLVKQDWYDTYEMAAHKDDGYTVRKKIDGWTGNSGSLRIDYIFADRPLPVKYSRVIFDGHNEPVVSDHFGVAVEIR